jgi:hypothetical protein
VEKQTKNAEISNLLSENLFVAFFLVHKLTGATFLLQKQIKIGSNRNPEHCIEQNLESDPHDVK